MTTFIFCYEANFGIFSASDTENPKIGFGKSLGIIKKSETKYVPPAQRAGHIFGFYI
ncbi:hypothetical protein APA_1840 [Pseudanabaena sp. lw0831]|nr:hypothetical protein APA_1840 [Pseudanabaena sp. lw0831]